MTAPVVVKPPPLFAPLALRSLTLPNRAVIAPELGPAIDGRPADDAIDRLAAAARGGAGLMLLGPIAICATGRITPEDAGLYDDAQQPWWAALVQALHTAGARVGLQLNHAGRRGATRPRREGLDRPLRQGAWPLLAPSPLPFHSHSQAPQPADEDALATVRAAFVDAAARADAAGIDLLHLNAGHGYLLGSFLSPLTNQRDDAYGGSLEGRLAFPLAVVDAVRAAWPAHKPLAVALNATDYHRDGTKAADAAAVARVFRERGADLFEFWAGQTAPTERPQYGPGHLVRFSDRLRHEAGVRTLVRGHITTSGEANAILAAGRADLVLLDPP